MNNVGSSKNNSKAFFTYATIALLTLCALVGIVMIFVGTNTTTLCLVSTLLIFYMIALLSTRSIARLSDKSSVIRVLSALALVANLFWSIPWVLLVWDVFGAYPVETRDLIWRFLWTAGDLSIFCTVAAGYLIEVRWRSLREKLFSSLPLVMLSYVAFDILIIIWVFDSSSLYVIDLLGKFILAESILVALQVVVTQILRREEKRKMQQTQIGREFQAQQGHIVSSQDDRVVSDDGSVMVETETTVSYSAGSTETSNQVNQTGLQKDVEPGSDNMPIFGNQQ